MAIFVCSSMVELSVTSMQTILELLTMTQPPAVLLLGLMLVTGSMLSLFSAMTPLLWKEEVQGLQRIMDSVDLEFELTLYL